MNYAPFPVGLVRFNLPPVRHVAAVAAVELLRNVVVTSWALIPIVLLRFHCFCLFFQILFEQVQKPRSMIVGCPKLAQLTTQVDQHFENRGFEFCVFNEAIEPREIIHDAANSFPVIWHGRTYRKTLDAIHPRGAVLFRRISRNSVTKIRIARKTIAG